MWSLGCATLEMCRGSQLPPEWGHLDEMDDQQVGGPLSLSSMLPHSADAPSLWCARGLDLMFGRV